jgi:hypothetical protein
MLLVNRRPLHATTTNTSSSKNPTTDQEIYAPGRKAEARLFSASL